MEDRTYNDHFTQNILDVHTFSFAHNSIHQLNILERGTEKRRDMTRPSTDYCGIVPDYGTVA